MNLIVWSNLSSGLLGAVIGSIAGFLGSLFLNWRNDKSNRRSAGRAVLAEIVMNQETFKQTEMQSASQIDSLQAPQFSRIVMQDQLALVAKLLDWNDLVDVITPYVRAAELVTQFDRAINRANELDLQAQEHQNSPSFARGLKTQACKMRASAARDLPEVYQQFAKAAEVLCREVLSHDELQDHLSSRASVGRQDAAGERKKTSAGRLLARVYLGLINRF